MLRCTRAAVDVGEATDVQAIVEQDVSPDLCRLLLIWRFRMLNLRR